MAEITGEEAHKIIRLVDSFNPLKAESVPEEDITHEVYEIQFLKRLADNEEIRAVLYAINFFGKDHLWSPTYYYLHADRAAFGDFNEDKTTRPFYASSFNVEAVYDDLLSATTCFNQISQAIGLSAADRIVNLRG